MPTLYDQYGRPVDLDGLKEPQAHATFGGIRNIYSHAHPSVGLTPERLGAILLQAEWGDPFLYLELAQDMEEKYPHYLSVMGTRKMAAAGQEMSISPASSSAHDHMVADFVRGILMHDSGLTLESALVDIQDAVGKGFSVTEIMWETAKYGGKVRWLPTALRWRDPRWFMFDWISGEQILVRTWKNEQSVPTGDDLDAQRRASMLLLERTEDSSYIGLQPATAPLRPFKFITHVAKAKSGLPVRGGMARSLAWVSLFWNYTLKDWVIFAERFGVPARVGKYPTGATEAEQERLLKACAAIGSDATAIIPEVMNIELLVARNAGGARSQSVFADLTRYVDDLCSKAILGQTLTVESPARGGSKAQGAVHEHVRRDILAWDVKRLSQTLTRDLVKPLVDLNLGPQEQYPFCVIGVPDSVDTKIFIDAVSQAVDRGVEIGQTAVREKIGVPAPTDDEKLMQPKVSGTREDAYQESGKHKEDFPAPSLHGSRRRRSAQSEVPGVEPLSSSSAGMVARAIVVNEMGLVLIVRRVGEPYVMLPGGHLADGETYEMAAVREVYEETGVDAELVGWVADFTDERGVKRYFRAKHVSGTPHGWDHDDGVAVVAEWVPVDEALVRLTSQFDHAALTRTFAEQPAAQALRAVSRVAALARDATEFDLALRELES